MDILQTQLDEYKKEWQKTAENRDRMVQMLNQHEAKLNQLSGAISALERVMNEQVTSEATQEGLPNEQVNDNAEPTKS